MSRRDDNGLAWKGCPPPKAAGGFVDGVELNGRTHALAVDPEGVVAARPSGAGSRAAQLSVERLDDRSEGPVQRNGRVRMIPR